MSESSQSIPYPWQQAQWHYLHQRVVAERLPHAWLFAGQEGVGKMDFAKGFIQRLLCEQVSEAGMACGDCRHCRLCRQHHHPDIHWVLPEQAGGVIKIDAIRQLCRELTSSSFYGGYRIAVVAPAEAMNIASANALLKTLEEPVENTVLILLAHHPEQLPLTIRSRCQRLTFQAARFSEAAPFLQASGVSQERAALALSLTLGSPLLAKQWLQQAESQQWRQPLLTELSAVMLGHADPIVLAEKCMSWPYEVLLHHLNTWLSDLIKVASGVTEQYVVNQDCVDAIKTLAAFVDLRAMFASWRELLTYRQYALNNINLNQQLVLETLFCRMKMGVSCQ